MNEDNLNLTGHEIKMLETMKACKSNEDWAELEKYFLGKGRSKFAELAREYWVQKEEVSVTEKDHSSNMEPTEEASVTPGSQPNDPTMEVSSNDLAGSEGKEERQTAAQNSLSSMDKERKGKEETSSTFTNETVENEPPTKAGDGKLCPSKTGSPSNILPISEKKKQPATTPVNLPNAMKGKDYTASLDEIIAFREEWDLADIDINGSLPEGLRLDKEARKIVGVPQKDGDYFIFSLQYRFRKGPNSGLNQSRELKLTINPDPRSLWRDLPSDKNVLYWKHDSAVERIAMKERVMVAASQRGRSHAHEGKPRDDHFALKYLDSGWYLMAVADGAGSAKYSREGSRIACEIALEVIENKIDEFFKKDKDMNDLVKSYHTESGGNEAKKTLRELAYKVMAEGAFQAKAAISKKAVIAKEELKDENICERDFATTLILAAVKHYKSGWFVSSYWVGDGGIGIYSQQDGVELLGEPDGGEFAGQTRFLTMGDIWSNSGKIAQRIRASVVDDFTAIILMTDGVTDPKFDTENNLKRKECWESLWKELSDNTTGLDPGNTSLDKQLLEWLNFWTPGNHDDRTIAILL